MHYTVCACFVILVLPGASLQGRPAFLVHSAAWGNVLCSQASLSTQAELDIRAPSEPSSCCCKPARPARKLPTHICDSHSCGAFLHGQHSAGHPLLVAEHVSGYEIWRDKWSNKGMSCRGIPPQRRSYPPGGLLRCSTSRTTTSACATSASCHPRGALGNGAWTSTTWWRSASASALLRHFHISCTLSTGTLTLEHHLTPEHEQPFQTRFLRSQLVMARHAAVADEAVPTGAQHTQQRPSLGVSLKTGAAPARSQAQEIEDVRACMAR